MEKKEIRNRVLKIRDELTVEELKERSRVVFNKITENNRYKEAENILVYASKGSEVATDELILDALSSGKNVFCPKVTDKKNGWMEFVRIASPEDLSEGYFHIREPEIDGDSEIYEGRDPERTLVIVPVVAFDKDRNRIGYGGGFYDRYLERFPMLYTIGIAFECQMITEGIPAEMYDMRPSMIVTEC